jgi:predicted dehydrogenase
MDRRTFLLASGGAMWAQTAPSDRIGVGTIGSGGRGRYLMSVFTKDPAVRHVAVCDVYEPNLEAGLSAARSSVSKEQAKAYRNYKALLDDKSVDAVIIATPEHWHHRMLLDALAVGKDVYVEKPLCQTPEQGVELMDAARASKSVVQVGMQRRSYDLYLKARDIRAAGSLGAVRLVRSWWINNSLRTASNAVLKGPLDWEQWQGPAKRHALEPDRFFNWRAYKDYSGGIVADQGAHIYDGIHLIRGVGFPSVVNASGGLVHSKADTPETVVVAAEYPDDFLGIFTINYAGMRYPTRLDQLNQFDGDQARMDVGREFLAVYPQAQPEKASIAAEGSFNSAAEMHVRNFLDCVRSRKEPNGTVEKGFQAALVVQLANRSLEFGRRMRWDIEKRKVEV